MNRKFLISLFVCIAILLSSVCFATDAGQEAQSSGEKTESTLDNIGNGIRDTAQNVGNGIRDAAQDIGNGVQDFFNGDMGNNDAQDAQTGDAAGIGTSADGYTSTRTSSSGNARGMSNTAWVWLIMAIVGVIIVALTWYYVSQDTNNKR